ncbi:MAG: chemotaxis protein CheW [Deltaproteobacteria bacterium]|nr:chemotaxis protein CheW [Deltaproteobacteria bacterium]
MGLSVDSVSGVLRIPSGIIEPAPQISSDINEFIKGIAELEDRPVLFIDIDRLMKKSWITVATRAI